MQTDSAQDVGGHVIQELLIRVNSIVLDVPGVQLHGQPRALDVGLGQLVQGERGGEQAPEKAEHINIEQNIYTLICCGYDI